MSTDRPNILVLTLDAVRPDRLSLTGYDRPTSPVLKAFAKDALVCDQAIAPASFTEICFPPLMTSTLPLSYGGYDHGGAGRPDTLAKVCHDAGYHVTQLSNVHWINRYHGYGEGVDVERHFFALNTVMGAAIATMRSTLWMFDQGKIGERDMLAVVGPVVEKLCDDLDDYCKRQISDSPPPLPGLASAGVIYDRYDYAAVRRVVATHRAAFRKDNVGYVRKYLCPSPGAHEWMAKDWRFRRAWPRLLGVGFNRMINRAVALVNPSRAMLRNNPRKRYADAAGMAELTVDAINSAPTDAPFYIWTHFMDAHMPYCPGAGLRWFDRVGAYLSTLGYGPDIDPATALLAKPRNDAEWRDWSALYDAVLLYIDEQIGRILEGLRAAGHADNTIIAIVADHGEELGEHGHISHYFRLYDHNVRVPMLFSAPGLEPARIAGQTSTLDFAPTVAALAGIQPLADWRGRVLGGDSVGAKALVGETFFGGNCDFDRRPIYMGVRTEKLKYIWKEYDDPTDFLGPAGHELYDLVADPDEQQNIYADDHPALFDFNVLIARRMLEIPELGPARVAGAFPAGVMAAVSGSGVSSVTAGATG